MTQTQSITYSNIYVAVRLDVKLFIVAPAANADM